MNIIKTKYVLSSVNERFDYNNILVFEDYFLLKSFVRSSFFTRILDCKAFNRIKLTKDARIVFLGEIEHFRDYIFGEEEVFGEEIVLTSENSDNCLENTLTSEELDSYLEDSPTEKPSELSKLEKEQVDLIIAALNNKIEIFKEKLAYGEYSIHNKVAFAVCCREEHKKDNLLYLLQDSGFDLEAFIYDRINVNIDHPNLVKIELRVMNDELSGEWCDKGLYKRPYVVEFWIRFYFRY